MRAVIPLHLFSYYYTLLVELKFIKLLTAGLTHHIVIKKRRGGEENKYPGVTPLSDPPAGSSSFGVNLVTTKRCKF